MALEFFGISADASALPESEASQMVRDVVASMQALYTEVGYEPPWIGYLVREDDTSVGTCAFKGPPVDDRVEIAYFTFPEYESRGLATRMAARLIEIARSANPDVIITAQTLPEENASTRILNKLGFSLIGTVNHPEDGLVWEWQATS